MKPATVAREIQSSGDITSAKFGISADNQVHILTILRDTLYTNKILAVLREYSANAWDAHREVGKEDLPIKVVLPTELEASVIIRDYGPGMSEDEVYTIYTQYGASTKRGDNVAVGMLGIGSKSGFAYNDAFTITSWNGGWKRVYHAVLDESNVGKIMKLYEAVKVEHIIDWWIVVHGEGPTAQARIEALGGNVKGWVDPTEYFEEKNLPEFCHWLAHEAGYELETGIEIKVPVNPSDVNEFHKEAKRLFRYFRPMPNINTTLSEPPSTWKTPFGYLRRADEHRYEDAWVAVMGCVPYRLNMDQLSGPLEEAGLTSLVQNLRGGLYFDIGDVDIVANREDLEYKQRTKDAIIAQFAKIIEHMSQELDTIISDDTITAWDKRNQVRDFSTRTGLPITDKYKEWRTSGQGVALYSWETLKDAAGNPRKDADGEWLTAGPKTFRMKKRDTSWTANGNRLVLQATPLVVLAPNSRFLILDVTKPWRGYVDNENERVIEMLPGFGVAAVEKELNQLIDKANLTGIEINRMSDMEYVPFSERAPNPYEKKHCETVFELTGTSNCPPLSQNWEIIQHTPDPDDVFVIINRFMPTSHGANWFGTVSQDRTILKKLFDEDMPQVIGYKTTSYKPISADKVEGTYYDEWIVKTFQTALGMHPEVQDLLDSLLWSQASTGQYQYQREGGYVKESHAYKFLKANLDGRHRLVRLFAQRHKYSQVISKLGHTDGKHGALQELARRLPSTMNPAFLHLDRIGKKYPLLRVGQGQGNEDGLAVFAYKDQQAHWLQYVNLIDQHTDNDAY